MADKVTDVFLTQQSGVGGPGSVALVCSGVRAGGLEVGAQRAPRLLVIYIL